MSDVRPRHTLRASILGGYGWDVPSYLVDCPFEADDPERDCSVEGSDECVLQHWLDAAGTEGIEVRGMGELPVTGVVAPPSEDWPIFILDAQEGW